MNENPTMSSFWDHRYGEDEYAYGIEPNEFFKTNLDQFPPGSILLPADGEGRNSIYAAESRWKVTAFDYCSTAKQKAMRLARYRKVEVDYTLTSVLDFRTEKKFDVVALIYAHFPVSIRNDANMAIAEFLKPGGVLIFEAFAKSQLGRGSGGPQDSNMLFSRNDVKNEFQNIDFKFILEMEVPLNEGKYHRGKAMVIRALGVKRQK